MGTYDGVPQGRLGILRILDECLAPLRKRPGGRLAKEHEIADVWTSCGLPSLKPPARG